MRRVEVSSAVMPCMMKGLLVVTALHVELSDNEATHNINPEGRGWSDLRQRSLPPVV